MNNKEKYIELIADENFLWKVPVFSNPLWLDTVADNWDVCITEEKGKITGVLPYCVKGKFLTKRIYLPYLNFYQSPILPGTYRKEQKALIIHDLFQQLPTTVKSNFKFLPEYIDADISGLGYSKEEYVTYFLPAGQDRTISKHHSRNIQKGIKHYFITEESKALPVSYSLITSTFERQKIKPKISEAAFIKIVKMAIKNNMGKVLDCLDTNKNVLATAFIAEDKNTMYYLLSGYNSAYKNSGAMVFLLNTILQDAFQKKLSFNFCGSSKKSIATFFEGFGAQKIPIAIWQKSIL